MSIFLFSCWSSWPGFVDSPPLYKQSISERKHIIRTETDSCQRSTVSVTRCVRWTHLRTQFTYISMYDISDMLVTTSYLSLLFFIYIPILPLFPTPATYICIPVKWGSTWCWNKRRAARNITSMKQSALEKHFRRNIVKGGRSLLYRNSLAGRKKVKVLRANTKDIETMIINDHWIMFIFTRMLHNVIKGR